MALDGVGLVERLMQLSQLSRLGAEWTLQLDRRCNEHESSDQ